ncbi:MAG: flippase-like domain-containing protein [Thermoplasmata archaeon]|nr:MAG: flippase-like domain-containing protein [Thermoplasmata archaeon]
MNTRFLVTIILSILVIILMLWVSNPSEFADKLQNINLKFILLVIGLYFANVFTKAYRWYLLVNSTGVRVPFKKTFPFFIIGLAFNNVTPGKIGGEPIRAYLLKKDADVPVGQGLASILTEKIMDIIVIATMAIIGAAFILPLLSAGEAKILIILLIFVISVITATLIILSHAGIFARIVNALVKFSAKRPNNKFVSKWTSALVGFVDKFKLGISKIFEAKRTAGGCIVLTVIIWINEALRLYIIFWAMPGVSGTSLGAVFIAASIANILGIVMPLGSGNIFGIGAVFIALGMEPSSASLAGFLHAATSVWISIPMGVGAMLITGYKGPENSNGDKNQDNSNKKSIKS